MTKLRRTSSPKPDWQKDIAKERIHILFKLATGEFADRPDRSKRYVALARRIAMRYNVRLGKLKQRFCGRCGAFLVPGKNCTVRMHAGRAVTTCKECDRVTRFPYKQAKRTGRK